MISMKKFHIIFILSLSLGLLLFSSSAYAISSTMSAYYPSPSGQYTKIHLINSTGGPNENPTGANPCFCAQNSSYPSGVNGGVCDVNDPANPTYYNTGTIFTDSTSTIKLLEICQSDGSVATFPGVAFSRYCSGGSGCAVSQGCPTNYIIVSGSVRTYTPFAGMTSYTCALTNSGDTSSTGFFKSGCFSIYSTTSGTLPTPNPASCSSVDPNAFDMGCTSFMSNPGGTVCQIYERTCCFNGGMGGNSIPTTCTSGCTPSCPNSPPTVPTDPCPGDWCGDNGCPVCGQTVTCNTPPALYTPGQTTCVDNCWVCTPNCTSASACGAPDGCGHYCAQNTTCPIGYFCSEQGYNGCSAAAPCCAPNGCTQSGEVNDPPACDCDSYTSPYAPRSGTPPGQSPCPYCGLSGSPHGDGFTQPCQVSAPSPPGGCTAACVGANETCNPYLWNFYYPNNNWAPNVPGTACECLAGYSWNGTACVSGSCGGATCTAAQVCDTTTNSCCTPTCSICSPTPYGDGCGGTCEPCLSPGVCSGSTCSGGCTWDCSTGNCQASTYTVTDSCGHPETCAANCPSPNSCSNGSGNPGDCQA